MTSIRMLRFLSKRVIQGVFVLWGVATLVFLLRFITPGSPVDFVVPPEAGPELRERIAHDLGLHQPFHIQYLEYLFGLLQGDMGYSYISGTAAAPRIFARLVPTIELALVATLMGLILSIPFGVISATRRHRFEDYVATLFSLIGISTPNFWLGIMLILVVAVQFGLLPTSRRIIGFLPALELLFFEFDLSGIRTWLSHITLPAITLGTFITALFTRLTRSGMLDELGKPYVQATKAKGIPNTLVKYKHALRNTLIPIITVVGLQLGTLVGGAVVVEVVFSWPGLGTLLINSVNKRDWPLIQGILIIIGLGFVTINIIVDAIYAYADPRVMSE